MLSVLKRTDSMRRFIRAPCADPESFVRGGLTLTFSVFKLDEWREDPNTTLSGSCKIYVKKYG